MIPFSKRSYLIWEFQNCNPALAKAGCGAKLRREAIRREAIRRASEIHLRARAETLFDACSKMLCGIPIHVSSRESNYIPRSLGLSIKRLDDEAFTARIFSNLCGDPSSDC